MKKKLTFLSNRTCFHIPAWTCIRIPNQVHHIHELPLLLFLVQFRVLHVLRHHFNVLGPSFLVQQLEDILKRKKNIYKGEKSEYYKSTGSISQHIVKGVQYSEMHSKYWEQYSTLLPERIAHSFNYSSIGTLRFQPSQHTGWRFSYCSDVCIMGYIKSGKITLFLACLILMKLLKNIKVYL